MYYGQLTDEPADMGAFLLAHHNALPRHNPRISGGTADATAAPLQLPLVGDLAPGVAGLASLGYLHHSGTEEGVKIATHWIVIDVTAEAQFLFPFWWLSHLKSPLSEVRAQKSTSNLLSVLLKD